MNVFLVAQLTWHTWSIYLAGANRNGQKIFMCFMCKVKHKVNSACNTTLGIRFLRKTNWDPYNSPLQCQRSLPISFCCLMDRELKKIKDLPLKKRRRKTFLSHKENKNINFNDNASHKKPLSISSSKWWYFFFPSEVTQKSHYLFFPPKENGWWLWVWQSGHISQLFFDIKSYCTWKSLLTW